MLCSYTKGKEVKYGSGVTSADIFASPMQLQKIILMNLGHSSECSIT